MSWLEPLLGPGYMWGKPHVDCFLKEPSAWAVLLSMNSRVWPALYAPLFVLIFLVTVEC